VLKRNYDFIVCGSGSSGSVVARRLAESPDVSVLLVEAGGEDDVEAVSDAASWITNLGSERDWQFQTRPNPHLNGRSLAWGMGKVLGGGSSINAMIWSRGHKNDWDSFAAESGDPGWSHASILDIYRRIEDWHGDPDPKRRGTGGLVFVQPSPDPSPIAPAMLEAARSLDIPTFADANGAMMEGRGGCALCNMRVRNGKRLSVFRTYVHPFRDRQNLTVLTDALVTRVIVDGKRTVGVEILVDGRTQRIGAGREVVLALGAIHTPKVLMQSGVGDEEELRRFGIDVVEHLPGVGRNLQDHPLLAACLWEYEKALAAQTVGPPILFWKSHAGLDTPDLQLLQAPFPLVSPEIARRHPPEASWSMAVGLVRPRSRGRVHLTGASPSDPVDIDANQMADPADMEAMLRGVQLAREVGNSPALRSVSKREVLPGDLRGTEVEQFVRDAVITYWHYAGSAKMGRDPLSVVDSELRVYGIERLRIADASIMPRVTTGNTMAPCVIIGERAAELIRRRHGLSPGS
jgi:choline dehydrogenase